MVFKSPWSTRLALLVCCGTYALYVGVLLTPGVNWLVRSSVGCDGVSDSTGDGWGGRCADIAGDVVVLPGG